MGILTASEQKNLQRYKAIQGIHVEFEALTQMVTKSTTFLDITPRSPLKVNQPFRGTDHLSSGSKDKLCFPPTFTLVFCLDYLTLKMTVICSSETSADFQHITKRYILDDGIPYKNTLCTLMHCSARSLLVRDANSATTSLLQIAFTAPSIAIILRVHSAETSR
jgi:hypothetical protein